MALAYNTTRSTRDIDAIFEPKMLAYQIAAEVAAEREDLPEDWLNDAVKAFPMPELLIQQPRCTTKTLAS